MTLRTVFRLLLLTGGMAVFSSAQSQFNAPNARLRNFATDVQATAAPDGGILICGFINYFNGEYSGSLIKLNASGNWFPGFQKVIADGWITKTRTLPSGKIMVMGDYTSINGSAASNLSRLNSDGTFDPSFTAPFKVDDFELQSDGKVIVLNNGSGTIYRLNTDGTLDNSFHQFSPGTGWMMRVNAADEIFVITYLTLVKLKPDGSVDASFPAITANNTVWDMEVIGDGVIMVGYFTSLNNQPVSYGAKINGHGVLDPNFSISKSGSGSITEVVVRADNSILIGGTTLTIEGVDGSVFELSPTGEFQNVLAVLEYGGRQVNELIEIPGSRVLVAGQFTTINTAPRVGIALINSDHSLDSDFSPDIVSADVSLMATPMVDPQGRITISTIGQAIFYNMLGVYDQNQPVNRRMFRLNPDGTFDGSYPDPLEATSALVQSDILADGSIILGGFLSGPPEIVARIKPDGTRDLTFNTQVSGFIQRTRVKGNSVYIGGQVSQVNGMAVSPVVKLDLNGNVAQTFSGLSQAMFIYDFFVQPDDKILVMYDTGVPTQRLIRLNADGSLDGSFSPVDFTGSVLDVAVAPDGKIYCAGSFSFVNTLPKKALVRLLPNGTPDNTFNIGAGFGTGYLLDVELTSYGSLIAGGVFTTFRNQTANGIVLINTTGGLQASDLPRLGRLSNVAHITPFNGHYILSGRLISENYQAAAGVLLADALLKPAAPTGLTGTVSTSGTVTLLWTDNSSTESGFIIERSVVDQNNFQIVQTTTANTTSYSEPIDPNKTYFYRVSAVNATGSSATTAVVQLVWDAPLAPTGLTGAVSTNGTVTLSWTDNSSNESGFIVERSLVDQNNYQTVQTTTANVTSYVEPIDPNKTYFYRVRAVNANGASAATAVVQLIWDIPLAPTGLTGTVSTTGTVTLSWTDNSSNESGFIIERSLIDQNNYQTVQTTTVNVTSYAEPIDPNKTYFYRVSAVNATGPSATAAVVQLIWDVPLAPTVLMGSVSVTGIVSLSWTDNSGNETGFIVERSDLNQNNFQIIQTTAANVTTFSETILAGKDYYYRVRAVNSFGSSASTQVALLNWDPINAPSALTGSVSATGTATLNWTDNSANETGFVVERSVNDQNNFQTAQTTAANTVSYSETIDPGKFYYYRVRGVNASGTSAFTSVVTLSWDNLQSPSALNGSAAGLNVTLSWNDNSSNETTFNIQRKLTSQGSSSYADVGSVGPGATSFVDNTVTYNQDYTYRVRASNQFSSSAYSNEVQIKTLSSPRAPTNLVATVSDKQIVLVWSDQSDNETGFIVERQPLGGTFTPIATISNANASTYTDTAPVGNTSYVYRVASFNAAGTSVYSNLVATLVTGLERGNLAISLYPNPTHDYIHVTIDDPRISSVALFDSKGELIPVQTQLAGAGELEIDLTSLQSGLYILKIKFLDFAYIHKVIKY